MSFFRKKKKEKEGGQLSGAVAFMRLEDKDGNVITRFHVPMEKLSKMRDPKENDNE